MHRLLFTVLIPSILLAPVVAFSDEPAGELFLPYKGIITDYRFRAVDSNAATITYDLTIVNNLGDSVRAKFRKPKRHPSPIPVAALVVGIETGKQVVDLIEGYDHIGVLGMDYPFRPFLDLSGWRAIGSAFSVREDAFKTVGHLLLCLDWLARQEFVDTSDIAIVAVSFGVFTAVPAAVIDPRVRRLAVIQAGGGMAEIIGANKDRLGIFLPAWFAGWFGSAVLASFEPNRYIADFSPRPFLLVSGESDRFFPLSTVRSLFDHAAEPKEWIRHPGGHVMPDEQELIDELTQLVARRWYGTQE